jgi:hypothetical protein
MTSDYSAISKPGETLRPGSKSVLGRAIRCQNQIQGSGGSPILKCRVGGRCKRGGNPLLTAVGVRVRRGGKRTVFELCFHN